MQRLNKLMQAVNAVSTVTDMVREKQTYRYGVTGPVSLYLHAEHGEVRLFRWNMPAIEIAVELQGRFGWRIGHEQDDAGVYFVARRRPLVGSIAGAVFALTVPLETHVILKLEHCSLWMNDVNGDLQIPPVQMVTQPALPAKI